MRKKISFKGVILGALVDVGGTNVWAFFLSIYILFQFKLYLLPQAQQTNKLFEIMMHDPMIFTINTIVGSAFSVLGGYVAAKIAKHNELLNATLSSFLCVISALSALGSPLNQLWMVLLGIIANPLLNLVGGYLRLWQIKKKGKAIKNSK